MRRFWLCLVLGSLVLGMLPSGGGITISPGAPVYFIGVNQNYSVTQIMTFSGITVSTNYIGFNNTFFNITNTGSLWINLTNLASDITGLTSDQEALDFNADSDGTVVFFNISGFIYGKNYNISKNTIFMLNQIANVSGGLSFNTTITSEHIEITASYYNPPSVATVTTNGSSGVEENDAILHGMLLDDGGQDCTVLFEYGQTTAYGLNSSNLTKNTGETFSISITGLYPGSFYHYRAVAINDYNTSYGSDMNFLTKPEAPTNIQYYVVNTTAINLNWTKGHGANNTVIVQNTHDPTSVSDGTIIYNDSAPLNSNVSTFYPNESGSNTEWTPSAGANYQCIDEAVSDGDATYVSYNGAASVTDLYNLPTHNSTLDGNKIDYVEVFINLRGLVLTNYYQTFVALKTNGVTYTALVMGSSPGTPTTYTLCSYRWYLNPSTGTKWTWSDIDSLQIGVYTQHYVGGGGWATTVRVTQVYAAVANSNQFNACNLTVGVPQYFRFWSYASFNPFVFSDNSSSIGWGGLFLNCFDEANGSNLTFDVVLVNKTGTETLVLHDCENTYILNVSDCPQGDDVAIMISSANHSSRLYYLDIHTNVFYVLNAYLAYTTAALPPDVNITYLYPITVINEASQTISDVFVTVKGLVNETSYEMIASGYTDGNGKYTTWLVPGKLYKVILNHTGYQDSSNDYIPQPPDDYGIITGAVFKMYYETITPQPPIFSEEDILWTCVYQSANNSLQINYNDTGGYTNYAYIFITMYNYSTNTTDLIGTYNSSSQTWEYYLGNVNRSNTYIIILTCNHEYLGVFRRTFVLEMEYNPPTTPAGSEAMFDWMGVVPFGATNFLMWMFLIAALYYADSRDAGKIVIAIGGIFLFLGFFINFNTTLLTVAGLSIPILFIVMGALMEWNESKKRGV